MIANIVRMRIGLRRAVSENAVVVYARARPLLVLAMLMPIAILAIGIYRNRWMADDGLIHVRVVQELRSGHGLVFNAGERVETSSSPLWVMLLAVLDFALPMGLDDLVIWTSAICMFLAFGIALVSTVADAHRREGTSATLVPCCAIVLGSFPALWAWSTSGMEVGLIALWLSVSWALCRRDSRLEQLSATTALVVGLGPVIRQDYVVWSALLLIAAAWPALVSRRYQTVARFAMWGAGPAFAYQIFRMGYFGLLVPNPTLAKNAGVIRFASGWDWLAWANREGFLFLPVLCAAVSIIGLLWGSTRGIAALTAAMWIGAGSAVAAAMAAGGDFMGARLAIPAIFGISVPVMYVALPSRSLEGSVRAARFLQSRKVVLVTAVVLSALASVKVVGHLVHRDIATESYFGAGGTNDVGILERVMLPNWRGKPVGGEGGVYGNTGFDPLPLDSPRATVFAVGLGLRAVTVDPDVHVFDVLGLANPVGSHLQLDEPTPAGVVGHEKAIPAAYAVAMVGSPGDLSAAIAAVQRETRIPSKLRKTPADSAVAEVAAAQRVLRCPPVQQLLEASRSEMSVSRFFTNFVNSFENTLLEIDDDPIAAEAALCD